MQYEELEINQHMIALANKRADQSVKKEIPYHGRYGTNRARMFTGFVGECMLAQLLSRPIADTFHFDFEFNGLKIDAKTTALPRAPEPQFSVTTNLRTPHAHLYVFLAVIHDHSSGWLLGCKTVQEWNLISRVIRVGEPLPSGMIVKNNDCRCGLVNQLDFFG